MEKLSLAVAFSILFFFSCTDSDGPAEQAISSTAETVVVLNMQTLDKKLDNEAKLSLSKQIRECLNYMSLDTKQMALFENILSDPAKAGLNINDRIFLYRGTLGEIGVVLNIADRDIFDDFIAFIIIDKGSLEKKKNISLLSLGKGLIAAWDDGRLLLVCDKAKPQEEIKAKVIAQLKQGEKESILDNQIFKAIDRDCKDMGVFHRIEQPWGLSLNYTVAANCVFRNGRVEAGINLLSYGTPITSIFRKFQGKNEVNAPGADFVIQTNVDSKAISDYMKEIKLYEPRLNSMLSQIDGDVRFTAQAKGEVSISVEIKDMAEVQKMIDLYSVLGIVSNADYRLHYIEFSNDTPLISMLKLDDVLLFNSRVPLKGVAREDGGKFPIEKNGIFTLQGNSNVFPLFSKDSTSLSKQIDTYKLILKNDTIAYGRVDFKEKNRNGFSIFVDALLGDKDKVKHLLENE